MKKMTLRSFATAAVMLFAVLSVSLSSCKEPQPKPQQPVIEKKARNVVTIDGVEKPIVSVLQDVRFAGIGALSIRFNLNEEQTEFLLFNFSGKHVHDQRVDMTAAEADPQCRWNVFYVYDGKVVVSPNKEGYKPLKSGNFLLDLSHLAQGEISFDMKNAALVDNTTEEVYNISVNYNSAEQQNNKIAMPELPKDNAVIIGTEKYPITKEDIFEKDGTHYLVLEFPDETSQDKKGCVMLMFPDSIPDKATINLYEFSRTNKENWGLQIYLADKSLWFSDYETKHRTIFTDGVLKISKEGKGYNVSIEYGCYLNSPNGMNDLGKVTQQTLVVNYKVTQ